MQCLFPSTGGSFSDGAELDADVSPGQVWLLGIPGRTVPACRWLAQRSRASEKGGPRRSLGRREVGSASSFGGVSGEWGLCASMSPCKLSDTDWGHTYSCHNLEPQYRGRGVSGRNHSGRGSCSCQCLSTVVILHLDLPSPKESFAVLWSLAHYKSYSSHH